MRKAFLAAFCGVTLAAAQAVAADQAPPKLVVTLAVDQFSADLFAQYRGRFTGGFARLAGGAVFPSGYQSHANTETCPGHSTILTGLHPGRTGIISNMWVDPKTKRDDKNIYCVEDETAPGTTSSKYAVSTSHFKAQTLGDRLKTANAASRVVAVSGKDRSAVMMAGHKPDEIWWWKSGQYQSYPGRKMPAAIIAANKAAEQRLGNPRAASELPAVCKPFDVEIPLTAQKSVGRGRLARAAKDGVFVAAEPEADGAVLDAGLQLIKDMKLGQGAATDVIALGLSATDYVGHYYGTEGTEMCIHLLALDQLLAKFFEGLDAQNVDYVVALTADHGGNDVPERSRGHGAPDAQRTDGTLAASAVGAKLGAEMGLKGPVLYGDPFGVGDVWIDPALTEAQKSDVLKRAVAFYTAHPQVAAAFTRAEILAAQIPHAPPDTWTLLQRARASYDPDRSGDFVLLLKPRVMPVSDFKGPVVATHGSPWDYDRRVPIIFWRKGMAGFEQPLSVETVDIMPTLAAMIGLKIPAGDVDGHCLFACEAK